MGFFEDAAVKAKDVFDVAVEKTTDVISEQKIRYNIAKINSKIAKDYEMLGRLYHDSKKSGEDNEDAANALIAGIESKQAEVSELEDQLAAAKNMIICDNCGAKNAFDASFCQKCGKQF